MTSKTLATKVREAMNRRQMLGLLGSVSAGVGMLAGCESSSAQSSTDGGGGAGADGGATPSCIVTPKATEGPFFVDEKLNRSDLLAGETDPATLSGYPLTVNLTVLGIKGQTCQALSNAYVDIWHANVNGLYSDEASNFVQSTDTKGQKYLRAYQVTGNDGMVRFKTIYPGWYATRTIHIHVKVRMYAPAGDKTLEGDVQLYFDDAMNDSVLALPVYASRGARSIPRNTKDQVYNGTGPGSGIDNVGLPSGQTPPGTLSIATVTPFNATVGSTANLTVGIMLP